MSFGNSFSISYWFCLWFFIPSLYSFYNLIMDLPFFSWIFFSFKIFCHFSSMDFIFTLILISLTVVHPQVITFSSESTWEGIGVLPCVYNPVVLNSGSSITINGRARALNITMISGSSLKFQLGASLELPKPARSFPYYSISTKYPATLPIVLSTVSNMSVMSNSWSNLSFLAFNSLFRDDNGEAVINDVLYSDPLLNQMMSASAPNALL